MKTEELKNRVVDGLIQLTDEWFGDNLLFKGIAKQIIMNNKNKYDYLFQLMSDENGDVGMDEIIKVIPERFEIDLSKWIPIDRILLLTRDDILKMVGRV
jgi:hypothetical protein